MKLKKRSIALAVSMLGLVYSSTAIAAEEKYQWNPSENSLALRKGEKVVWKFGLDSIYHRPHFHPLTFPDGTVFTDIHVQDHMWHLGLWFQPKKVNGLEYWQSGWRVVGKEYMPPEEAMEKGRMGFVDVRKVETVPQDDFGADIKTQTFYAPEKGSEPILCEDRVMTVSPPAADGTYHIDMDIRIAALSDIVFDKWPYGGFFLRTRRKMAKRTFISDNPEEPFRRSNAENPTRSKYFAVVNEFKDGSKGTALLMDHPDNIHYPSAWAKHWTPGAALTATGDIKLDKGQALNLKYRLQVFSGIPSKTEMDNAWREFAERK